MAKVLFLDTVHPYLQEELEKSGIECKLNITSTYKDIENCIHDYEGIVIRSRFTLDKSILNKASNLKFIARAGAGLENIDVDYAESKGIRCLHAPEGNRDAVGEHALGMLLALFNNLCKANAEVRNGKWIREGNRGTELMGKTVGIIGYGNMGTAFARRLQGFGVKVLAYDKYKKDYSDAYAAEATPENIFREADVLSLHVPLTEETHYLVNEAYINKFEKNIYIVNTARGKVINTFDLVKNMKCGKVLGACLDVLEFESLSFEDIGDVCLPEPFQYLIKSEKVILSPHIGGWTHESNLKIAEVLAEKIKNLICV